MQLREPYRRRSIRFLELWEPPGWRIKTYGIAYRDQRPPETLIDAAKRLAATPLATKESHHYGVGFLGVHAGRDSDWVFVGWWANENELHHHAFAGPSGAPHRLREATVADPIACTWDLALIGFERQAWIDAVLDNAYGKPDLEEYLRRRLDAAI